MRRLEGGGGLPHLRLGGRQPALLCFLLLGAGQPAPFVIPPSGITTATVPPSGLTAAAVLPSGIAITAPSSGLTGATMPPSGIPATAVPTPGISGQRPHGGGRAAS